MSLIQVDRREVVDGPIVVCVDDDHSLRILYWQSLSLQGYRCIPCESPEAVLQTVKMLPVALVVVDFEMPVMTGAELAGALRAIRPKLPILLMSGRSDFAQEDLKHIDRVCQKGSAASSFFEAIAALIKNAR